MHQCGEQVRSDHVDRQDVRAAEDTGVVDDGIHPSELIRLIGDPLRLLHDGQIANDDRRSATLQIEHRSKSLVVPSVNDDIMAQRQ